MVKMKQKRSNPINGVKSNGSTKGMNGSTDCHETSESNHSKTCHSQAVSGATTKPVNGSVKTYSQSGMNGTNWVANGSAAHPRIRSESQSSQPKSVSTRTRSPVAVVAKHMIQTKNALPSNESNDSFVTNTRQTPHSYPKTSQMSSLLSSAHQWSQSSHTWSDPFSQSHVRFAGSRFTEAPNPSLLPKPPKHWMSANAINTMATDLVHTLSTNGFDAKHNTTDDNIIATKLLQIYDMTAIEANSIANSGVKYGLQSYVN